MRILHGGDFLYPSLESQLWNGLQMVDAFNFMDAVAPLYAVAGNHEFDRRDPEQLDRGRARRRASTGWVTTTFSRPAMRPWIALCRRRLPSNHAARRIGVFSLTLNPVDGGNKRSYLENDGDYLGVAERTIESLERNGVDLIIGVTHLHMWQDVEIAAVESEASEARLHRRRSRTRARVQSRQAQRLPLS